MRTEAIARFRKGDGQPHKGCKLLGRWTRADFGGGFDLLETERGPDACERLALNIHPGGSTPTLEAAFDAEIGEIEGAWRDYLRAMARPGTA